MSCDEFTPGWHASESRSMSFPITADIIYPCSDNAITPILLS